MSLPAVPSWLNTALSSEKHITSVLRILASRETQRDASRTISRIRVFEEVVPPASKGLFSFLGRNKQEEPSHVDHYSITAGSQYSNKDKNRYGDITPYDRTRVTVRNGSVGHAGDPLVDRYLNANWVLERAGKKWWIAAQAPLPRTAHAFLSVLLQESVQPPCLNAPFRTRIRTVVQLTRNIEGGRRKADVYFPSEIGQSVIVSPEDGCEAPSLKLTLKSSKKIEDAHCVESTVTIAPMIDGYETSNAQTTSFKHLLYDAWPDHGVPQPEDRDSLLAFIRLVDSTNRDISTALTPEVDPSDATEDPDPPIIVGCSAGIGRTGTFIALSSLLREYGFLQPAANPTLASVLPPSPLGSLPAAIEEDQVAQEIDYLREQRSLMVQRQEQTLLIYEVLAAAFGLELS